MTDSPDIDDMDPDRWLSRMHRVRGELLQAIADRLSAHTSAEAAASSIETVLDQYELTEDGDSEPILRAYDDDGRLVLSCERSDETVVLVHEADDHWWFENVDFPSEDRRSDEELHAEVTEEILQLVPWWTEDAFTEKAGRPEDFI